MKKTTFLILISLMLLTFTACGTPVSSNEPDNSQNNTDYLLEEIVDNSILDEDLLNQFESLAKQRGYTIVELNDKKILFISLGEKNTSGYDLKPKNISKENGNIVITVEEIEPTDLVAQVISYPYKLYWLKGDITDISKVKVVDETGTEFAKITN